MHRAFKLSGDISFNEPYKGQWIKKWKKRNAENAVIVRDALGSFVSDGKINGSQLEKHWFPTLNADVFISHAREEEDSAFALAGFLEDSFGIISFLDSSVWGYAGDLLKQIDDDLCWQSWNETYNYKKRNGSTSHVHMMLATALAKMIDETECVIFASSPATVTTKESVETVSSPWIYFELTMMAIIRPRPIEDYRIIKEAGLYEFSAKSERLPIFYQANFDSLTALTANSLIKWEEKRTKKKKDALDELYKLVPHGK